MYAAALKVAKNPSCDRVEYVDLSSQRSVPKKSVVYFADCANYERFYIPLEEVSSEGAAKSTKEIVSGSSEHDLIQQCVNNAKSRVTFKNTFDYSRLNTNVYNTPQGRKVITVPINFKNAYNLEIKKKAQCIFDDRGMIDFSVSD